MDEKKTEVSIKVSAPYDADSCEGVLAICSWIKEAVCKCGIEIKSEEYSFRCSFKAGDISYDCYSVDEFKKHAFGQKIIVYTCYLVVYHDNDKIYFGISDKAWREDNICVSCNDKLLLLDLKTFLLKEKSILSDQSEGHISINAVNSSVVVGRDNTVNATITETCPKDNKPSFWTEILQGIVQNIVWVIVIAIIALIFAVFGESIPDWLR